MPADDPLQPLLDEAEAKLHRRLHDACEAEAHGIASDSAVEIRRLEDSLLSAAMAAEQVLTVRRHMQRNAKAAEKSSGSGDPPPVTAEPEAPQPPSEQAPTTVREFKDCQGRAWRAWPVTPGSARSGQPIRRTLGEFQEGWICFESVDDSARRRLPRREARWSELREEELERLLDQAINVPGRKHQASQVQPAPEEQPH